MRLLIPLLCLLLSGCSPTTANPGDPESYRPAPSSNLTLEEARLDAARVAFAHPGARFSGLQPTASMLPSLDSRSIIVYEPYTGQELHRGDWLIFDRPVDSQPNVLHRCEDVTETHVFMSGLNVPRSDGWVPKVNVKGRVFAVFYTQK